MKELRRKQKIQNPLKRISSRFNRSNPSDSLNGSELKRPNRINRHKVVTIGCAAFLVLAHIMILWATITSWRYYAIYPSLFGSVVAIILCLLAIIDIVFFVGFNHKDLLLKIVSTVMAILLLIGGSVGTYFISKANLIVNNVLDDGKTDKYEMFSGTFVYYRGNKTANNFKELKDLAGKKVGMLVETSNGLSYIATNLLSKEKIDYATVDYKTNAEMMQGLLDGDVDAIVITSAYRTIYKGVENTPGQEGETVDNDSDVNQAEETETETLEESEETTGETQATLHTEESPFAKYLDDLVDFYPFEQELKMNTTRSSKNISTEPFNVLLIGYSRTEIGSPVGLADSIILATINPQTYTVAMTSIARDSFVPVACYGGEYDKINSGRSTSRACFIETVEKFVGMDIDYYMELDYLGLVQIVNVIGGIYIDNPVSFTLDGIYVPAGHVFADGQMALQFARERHHMPNGDFDRQQHQKEVIIEIAKAFIDSGSITLPLRAMEEASEWMSTDFTLSQLTGLFNLLLNTKNFTSLETFDLVDFQNSRITGNGGLMYYSYAMRLPLWVYLVYEGSYNEAINHINNVMGNYKTIKQDRNFTFSMDSEYIRPALYSLDYDEKYMYTPDPMPPFWASLTDMYVDDAIAWASANGVNLKVEYINPGDPDYVESMENMVISQSPRYGSLISEYSSGSIVAMAPNVLDESQMVPDFVGKSYSKAKAWGNEYGVKVKINWETDNSVAPGTVLSQSSKPYTSIDDCIENGGLTIWVAEGEYEISFDKNGHGKSNEVPDTIKTKTSDKAITLTNGKYIMSNVKEDGKNYEFKGWYTEPDGGREITSTDEVSGNTTLYARWKEYCEHEYEKDDDNSKNPSCVENGLTVYKCKKCGETYSEEVAALGHEWEWKETKPAQVGQEGEETGTCNRCGSTTTRPIPPLPNPGD